MLLYKSDPCKSGVMRSEATRSSCYHPKAWTEAIYSLYTILICQQVQSASVLCLCKTKKADCEITEKQESANSSALKDFPMVEILLTVTKF